MTLTGIEVPMNFQGWGYVLSLLVRYVHLLLCMCDEFCYASRNPYMLYTMTVDGVACLIRLNNITNYQSCNIFPTTDVVKLNIYRFGVHGTITSIAATPGFLVLGKYDGWI
nr:hypothetical protein [Tanacetum cinerariifolium]